MDSAWRTELEGLLGRPPGAMRPVSGGDIGQAVRVEAGGRHLFVKHYPGAPPGVGAEMVASEAAGLAWLGEAGALAVPEVVAVSAASAATPLLVLGWVDSGRPVHGFDEALGRGLAALHRAGALGFGLGRDNFIGRLPQRNRSRPDWASFYARERIEPLAAAAADAGLLGAAGARRLARLVEALPRWLGPEEPPARLHGDLWSGNLIVGPAGEPVLIDPSVYGGHREMDLAMMQLFGGFSPRVFDAYAEAFPLAPGADERVPLLQLYPLLVHLNLFGSGYAAQVDRVVRRYVDA